MVDDIIQETRHEVHFESSQTMEAVDDETVHLVITSPPYPMIEMWDKTFSNQNLSILSALENGESSLAFELMHDELDKTWQEVSRVLVPGGIACINIGDATRTVGGTFELHPNHSRVTMSFLSLGFQALPCILWRKPTNAPTKFMGSGMLPPGAYVTLEHEYILIFRKGNRRLFNRGKAMRERRESAYFWEERNTWFSDTWKLRGELQSMHGGGTMESRARSGAFPFELAFRLVNMFSIHGDRVLDPFLGTGTTMQASMASCRNSIGYEIDTQLEAVIDLKLEGAVEHFNDHVKKRIKKHEQVMRERATEGLSTKYTNDLLGIPVVTRQETLIAPRLLESITKVKKGEYRVKHVSFTRSSQEPSE